jgi:hypothetical protein
MAEKYPLDWPASYPRATYRRRATYKSTWFRGLASVQHELRLMGIPTLTTVISTNQPIRNDGQPYAAQRLISDPGVAVYFRRKGREVVVCCDKWDRIEDNLRAVGLTLEAMRGLDRWGASEALDRVFQGFTALPPPAAYAEAKPWWEVLGVEQDWPLAAIEKLYRLRAKELHPDAGGGDAAEMAQLNRAIEECRLERGNANGHEEEDRAQAR